jgi:hypothetical protein
VSLTKIGGYPAQPDPDRFDEAAAEIVAYDAGSQRAFVVNAQETTVDILDLSDPAEPMLVGTIEASNLGDGINSVDVRNGLVAVAIEAEDAQAPGKLGFYDVDGNPIAAVSVGALPDMVTFSPNGKWVLVANEGEPNDDYDVDPEGSVSIVDVTGNTANLTDADVRTVSFDVFDNQQLDPSVRIFGPGASVAQDLEPEYIAVSQDSRTAWVVCQENNAIVVVDVPSATATGIIGLGFKDHTLGGNALDPSNRDAGIEIDNWPVLGMYQPDAIAAYQVGGRTYLVTANEGDARDYDGYSEEERIGDLPLDPSVFTDADTLQQEANLGRLNSTTANGDTDGDGLFEELYAYGARSFSIRNAAGELIWDSGDQFERILAMMLPDEFNSNNDENGSFDSRSDDKGPEPEGVALGKVRGRTYAFIGLERIGGIMVYDVTEPTSPTFVNYTTTRDFTGDAEAGTAGDLGPEGLAFVKEEDSPIGVPLLLVGHEVSGTTVIFRIDAD